MVGAATITTPAAAIKLFQGKKYDKMRCRGGGCCPLVISCTKCETPVLVDGRIEDLGSFLDSGSPSGSWSLKRVGVQAPPPTVLQRGDKNQYRQAGILCALDVSPARTSKVGYQNAKSPQMRGRRPDVSY